MMTEAKNANVHGVFFCLKKNILQHNSIPSKRILIFICTNLVTYRVLDGFYDYGWSSCFCSASAVNLS